MAQAICPAFDGQLLGFFSGTIATLSYRGLGAEPFVSWNSVCEIAGSPVTGVSVLILVRTKTRAVALARESLAAIRAFHEIYPR